MIALDGGLSRAGRFFYFYKTLFTIWFDLLFISELRDIKSLLCAIKSKLI